MMSFVIGFFGDYIFQTKLELLETRLFRTLFCYCLPTLLKANKFANISLMISTKGLVWTDKCFMVTCIRTIASWDNAVGVRLSRISDIGQRIHEEIYYLHYHAWPNCAKYDRW